MGTLLQPQALSAATRLASKAISITRDMTAASGDVAYTGVGFTPTALIGIFSHGTEMSVGIIDSSRGGGTINQLGDGSAGKDDSRLVSLIGTGASYYQFATVKSFDADGFTLTWTKGGSPTGNGVGIVLCFR